VHSLGGGTWRHVTELCKSLERQGHTALLLKYQYRGAGATLFDGDQVVFEAHSIGEMDALVQILKDKKLDFVHFHHVIGACRQIRALPTTLFVKYYVTIHDYYYMCPQVTMIDASGRYCGSPAPDQCDRCVSIVGPYDGLRQELQEHGDRVLIWRRSQGMSRSLLK
jgi:hypothetical protein